VSRPSDRRATILTGPPTILSVLSSEQPADHRKTWRRSLRAAWHAPGSPRAPWRTPGNDKSECTRSGPPSS
jgi:hypothetical protein